MIHEQLVHNAPNSGAINHNIHEHLGKRPLPKVHVGHVLVERFGEDRSENGLLLLRVTRNVLLDQVKLITKR